MSFFPFYSLDRAPHCIRRSIRSSLATSSRRSNAFPRPGTGYAAVASVAQLSATSNTFVARVHNWLVATWSLSIATQLGATLLIGYRVWMSIQWNPTGTQTSHRAVLWTLVESGALYTVTTAFLLGFSGTNIGIIFAAALGQISVRFLPSFSSFFGLPMALMSSI